MPDRFSSANRRIVIIGMKNSPITLMFESSGRISSSFKFIGNDWPAHLRFHRVIDKGAERVPEKQSEDDRKHRQQQIRNRRREVAVQLFAENHQNVSHQAAPVATGSSALHGSGLTGKLQEDLLEADGSRPQLVQIPARIDHGARQVAANEAVFVAFNLKRCSDSAVSL